MTSETFDSQKLDLTSRTTYTIEEGNTPWDVAKFELLNNGIKASDGAIVNELYRLAEINGCQQISELTQRFKVGSTIKLAQDISKMTHKSATGKISGYMGSMLDNLSNLT